MTRLKTLKVGDTVSIRQRGQFAKLHGELVYLQPEDELVIISDKAELERFLEMAPEYRPEK